MIPILLLLHTHRKGYTVLVIRLKISFQMSKKERTSTVSGYVQDKDENHRLDSSSPSYMSLTGHCPRGASRHLDRLHFKKSLPFNM